MVMPYEVGLWYLDTDDEGEELDMVPPPVYTPSTASWGEPITYTPPAYYMPEPEITATVPAGETTVPYTAPEYHPELPMITKPTDVPSYYTPYGIEGRQPYETPTGIPPHEEAIYYPTPPYAYPYLTYEPGTPKQPAQPTTIPSGGPSGAPRGGPSGGPSEEAEIDILGDLQWWANAASIQPLLRPWAGWLRELIEGNKTRAVPNPFIEDVEAEALKTELPEGATSVAGFASNQELMGRLKGLLGLEFGEEETPTSQWQKVITAIPSASLEAQQLMSSLRFDPNVGSWYAVDIDQLVNPKYL